MSFEDPNKGEKSSRLSDEEAEKVIQQLIPGIDFDVLAREMENEAFQSPELLSALARLVVELSDTMLNHDSILSDETSGRIPSLLLRKLINKKRESEGIKESIPTYFISGGRSLFDKYSDKPISKNIEAVKKFITEKQDQLGKALIVTEYIHFGRSIVELASILENCKIDYSIATVGISTEDLVDMWPLPKERALIYGESGGFIGDELHSSKAPSISGVEHSKSPSVHPVVQRGEERDTREIASARRDVDKLADIFSGLLNAKQSLVSK